MKPIDPMPPPMPRVPISSFARRPSAPFGVLVFAALGLGLATLPAQEEAGGLSGIDLTLRAQVLARVNGQDVTWGDVARRFRQRFGEQFGGMTDQRLVGMIDQAGHEVLDDVINEVLLAGAAEAAGVTVSTGEVDAAMAKLAAAMPDGTTIDEVTARVGVGQAELREDFADSIRIAKLIEQEAGGIREPTDADVKAFYELNIDLFGAPDKIRARHILIAAEKGDSEEVIEAKRKRAEEVRARLVGPDAEDFAAVAREVSEDASAEDGGDVGEFGPREMVPEFEAAAMDQEVGAIGPIVTSEYGFHIIKVESKDLDGNLPISQVKPLIVGYLKAEQERVMANRIIERLRVNAEIERLEPIR